MKSLFLGNEIGNRASEFAEATSLFKGFPNRCIAGIVHAFGQKDLGSDFLLDRATHGRFTDAQMLDLGGLKLAGRFTVDSPALVELALTQPEIVVRVAGDEKLLEGREIVGLLGQIIEDRDTPNHSLGICFDHTLSPQARDLLQGKHLVLEFNASDVLNAGSTEDIVRSLHSDPEKGYSAVLGVLLRDKL